MIQTTYQETYETDYHQWTIQQANLLKKLLQTHQHLKNIENLDWDNIIEEIETLGRSEYHAVVSLLIRQIEHHLKLDYVPLEECYRKWQAEIITFKVNMMRKYSPSMKPKLEREFSKIYRDALRIVKAEYDNQFPTTCPYNLDDLLFFEED